MNSISPSDDPAILQVGDLAIDFRGYRVSRAGRFIRLTPMQFMIFGELMNNAGKTLTFEELYGRANRSLTHPLTDPKRIELVVRSQVRFIRNALGDPNIIQAEDDNGYKILADGGPAPMRVRRRGGTQYRSALAI